MVKLENLWLDRSVARNTIRAAINSNLIRIPIHLLHGGIERRSCAEGEAVKISGAFNRYKLEADPEALQDTCDPQVNTAYMPSQYEVIFTDVEPLR